MLKGADLPAIAREMTVLGVFVVAYAAWRCCASAARSTDGLEASRLPERAHAPPETRRKAWPFGVGIRCSSRFPAAAMHGDRR